VCHGSVNRVEGGADFPRTPAYHGALCAWEGLDFAESWQDTICALRFRGSVIHAYYPL